MPDAIPPVPRADLPRRVGVWGAAAVMIGIIIGSGIFRTPAAAANHLGDPWVVLAFWLVGGVLALMGAMTYAELACMHPQSGGVYVFLREAYGRCVAFVFGWSYLLVIKPLAAAGIAVVFADHVKGLLNISFPADVQVITCVMLLVLTWINVMGVNLSTGVAKVLTGLKFAALAAIVLVPLFMGGFHAEHFQPTTSPGTLLAAIVPVMSAVMWTYDGWSDVGAIAGEVREPQRSLPRVFILGTLGVTALYLAVNAALIGLVSLTDMRTMETVAPAAFQRLLGPSAGAAVAAIVVVSTMGSTHGSIMTGARVSFQQARDGLLFRFLGSIHAKYQTPAVALWVQLALSCVSVIFVRYFEKLAGGFVFTMWIFYGLAAAAVFVLRVRRPDAPRPFRCPGYPVLPALFILAAIAMTALSIRDEPVESLRWLGIMAAGVPAYFIWSSLARPQPA